MKVLIVYNRYRHRVHGEEAVVSDTMRMLSTAGAQVLSFIRSAEGLPNRPFDKVVAGLAGIYNPRTRKQFADLLSRERPDVIHVHNLYPWISPSVLLASRDADIPVVMTVHHYGLTCPAMTHFRDGSVCYECVVKSEWQCVRHNCRKSTAQSIAYALRTGVARRLRWFTDTVSVFIALSDFARVQLERCGVPRERIVVRPNCIRVSAETVQNERAGSYVAFAGRLTFEKGVDLLCDAAAVTQIPVRIAGDVKSWPDLVARYSATVDFQGVLDAQRLVGFYRNARFLVVPSRWWEVCPLVVLEAMNAGCPVVASDSGGLPEMLDFGRTGLLFRSGSVEDLAAKMQLLWSDAGLRRQLRSAARARLIAVYDETSYIQDILAIYHQAKAA